MAVDAEDMEEETGVPAGAGNQTIASWIRDHRTLSIIIAAATLLLTAMLVFRRSRTGLSGQSTAGGGVPTTTVTDSTTAQAINEQSNLLEALAKAVQGLTTQQDTTGTPGTSGGCQPPGGAPPVGKRWDSSTCSWVPLRAMRTVSVTPGGINGIQIAPVNGSGIEGIAAYLGLTRAQLEQYNPWVVGRENLQPGQTLLVPNEGPLGPTVLNAAPQSSSQTTAYHPLSQTTATVVKPLGAV